MSTIAPDQLPTPAQIPAQIPAQMPAQVPTQSHGLIAATVATGRTALVRRLTVVGAVGVAVLGLGAAGVGLAGGGDAGAGGAPVTTDVDRHVGGDETGTASAGNASVDVAGAYVALFGVSPTADTAACIDAAAAPVIADVQAVVDGVAGSVDQVAIGMEPFASCVAVEDFDATMLSSAANLVAPAQLDESCAFSVLATFTATDRLDVLVTAATDPAQYDQRVFNTFGGCAF